MGMALGSRPHSSNPTDRFIFHTYAAVTLARSFQTWELRPSDRLHWYLDPAAPACMRVPIAQKPSSCIIMSPAIPSLKSHPGQHLPLVVLQAISKHWGEAAWNEATIFSP